VLKSLKLLRTPLPHATDKIQFFKVQELQKFVPKFNPNCNAPVVLRTTRPSIPGINAGGLRAFFAKIKCASLHPKRRVFRFQP